MRYLPDLIATLGLIGLTAGCALIYFPLTFIVPGGLLLFAGIRMAWIRQKDGSAEPKAAEMAES